MWKTIYNYKVVWGKRGYTLYFKGIFGLSIIISYMIAIKCITDHYKLGELLGGTVY